MNGCEMKEKYTQNKKKTNKIMSKNMFKTKKKQTMKQTKQTFEKKIK